MPIATRDAVVGLRRRARFAGAGADVHRRLVQVLGGRHPRWKASTTVGVRRGIAARARFARDEEETMAKSSVAGVQLQDAGRQLVHLSRHVDVRRCCEWLD